MNPAQGSGNGGFNGGGGQNGQGNDYQNTFQQQLVQQLSQQLSQQMGQKFPQQANILSALASVQSQIQNPQQQLPPDLLALARSGNLAGVAGLLGGNNNNNSTTTDAPAASHQQPPPQQLQQQPAQQQQPQQPQPQPPEQQPSAPAVASAAAPPADASASGQQGDDVRQRLLQQLSRTAPPVATSTAAAAAPKDNTKATGPPPALGHVGEVRAGFQGQPSAPASANLTADAVKDERRKAPGSVIVPCRARGMPMDHNFKTAYFVIPENVRHGEELICSYFVCRNAGVKFRYCSHCKVPVAKRNFRKRHKHGDNMGKDGVDDDDHSGTEEDGCSDEGEPSDMPSVPSQVTTGRSKKNNEAIPTQVTTNREERVAKKSRSEERSKNQHVPSQVTTSSNNNGGKREKKKSSKNSQGKAKSGPASDCSSVCMRSGDDRAKVIESRRRRWAFLLEKRPQTKDGEAMSSWLMQVLAVSDLWKPLNEGGKTPNASLDLIRECAQAGTEKKEDPRDNPGSSAENQNANNAENSSHDSDEPEDGGESKGGGDGASENNKKSGLLKKRPVLAMQDGDGDEEDKGEPPESKAKR